MAFGNSKTVVDKHGKGGDWITLEENKPVKVVFLGDDVWGPAKYAGRRYGACFPETDGKNVSIRFATSVYECGGDKDSEPQDSVKYLEGSLSLFQSIGEIASELGSDFLNTIVKIEKKSNTDYQVRSLKQISDGQQGILSNLERIDLSDRVNWLNGVDIDELREWNRKEEEGDSADTEKEEDDDDVEF